MDIVTEMANTVSIEKAIIAREVDVPAWFSTREAAAHLGVSVLAMRRAIKAGHVLAERKGRRFRISRDALDRYRVEQEGNSNPEPRPTLSLVPFPDIASQRLRLPAALTLFVGRETELAALREQG